jgi:hypothetical protein
MSFQLILFNLIGKDEELLLERQKRLQRKSQSFQLILFNLIGKVPIYRFDPQRNIAPQAELMFPTNPIQPNR